MNLRGSPGFTFDRSKVRSELLLGMSYFVADILGKRLIPVLKFTSEDAL